MPPARQWMDVAVVDTNAVNAGDESLKNCAKWRDPVPCSFISPAITHCDDPDHDVDMDNLLVKLLDLLWFCEQKWASEIKSADIFINVKLTFHLFIMLVTFLVFASFSLLLLMLLLWYLWPSSRVSTSVPGQSPSHQTLGNIPNITDAGGLPHYLQSLHQQHGMVASFWIGDYLAISLASPNLFKLVGEPSTFLYQSIVPLINNAEILEKRSSAGSMINSIMSNFSPFSNTWSEN